MLCKTTVSETCIARITITITTTIILSSESSYAHTFWSLTQHLNISFQWFAWMVLKTGRVCKSHWMSAKFQWPLFLSLSLSHDLEMWRKKDGLFLKRQRGNFGEFCAGEALESISFLQFVWMLLVCANRYLSRVAHFDLWLLFGVSLALLASSFACCARHKQNNARLSWRKLN